MSASLLMIGRRYSRCMNFSSCRTMVTSSYINSPPKSSQSQSQKLTVWYDGGCPLCIREISLFARWDKAKHIKFVDLTHLTPTFSSSDNTDAGVSTMVCPLDKNLMLERFHATIHDTDVTLSGAAAFAAMWSCIPKLRPIGTFVSNNPRVLNMLERLYLLFLKVRPKFQVLARIYFPHPNKHEQLKP